ncbi:Y-family DNA polymerase [Epilithonimonas arachidiradicis]|uniref:DNA polymerase V n=1 Tax=Epilithonimonas arachidiradicis TaxID=1617282 RepID=A0A420DC41_9FLAO|nr:Y-family DNA polymerase [Epilithonimonas arachidiradicis]RKE88865.1 DNA polymerase V [Epilithonimonas arachidiradicis]GGG54471.1 SOS mutagenesis and repair protein UmuC [Epilithonimonas arachidiradicis]
MYALLDCNNFFVSCERTLDPTLEDHPVVVLSNNDGCVVSRSNEAKELGIPMGAPAFKYKDLFAANNVKVLSAKFELYNFRSQQVMEMAKSFLPNGAYEIYSIDELFLDFNGFKYFNLNEYCCKIRQKINDDLKLPTSIGIAPTKTLCKIANHIVKKETDRYASGVYIMDSKEKIEEALKNLDIENVWGIGRRLSAKMKDSGVYKAWDLLQKPEMWVRKIMGIHGVRMINELKGIPQLKLDKASDKKSIMVSRSFMKMVTNKEEIAERIETFAIYCAEKLRKQNSCCKVISVFIQTNRFRKELGEYKDGFSIVLPNPSSSSIVLAKYAHSIFEAIYKEGFHYKKAGVMVSDFVPDNERLINLFENDIDSKHIPIMKAIDKLNSKYGKDKIRLGGMSGKNTYGRAILSPEYEEFLKNNTLPEANYRFQ